MVKYVLIPAAGYGTRLLPVTRVLPKAILPLGTTPILVDVLWEAYKAGIREAIIVTHWRENVIKRAFENDLEELVNWLRLRGREDLVELLIRAIPPMNIIFVHQEKLNGLGGAILLAEEYVDDVFAVMLADNIILENQKGSLLSKMISARKLTGADTVLSVAKVMPRDVSRFGIIKFSEERVIDGIKLYHVEDLIEKPPLDKAPSNMAIVGRYIFTLEIFDYLRKVPEERGEIDETKAFKKQIEDGKRVIAIDLEDRRWFDVGNLEGYFKAFLAFIAQEEGKKRVEEWIREIL